MNAFDFSGGRNGPQPPQPPPVLHVTRHGRAGLLRSLREQPPVNDYEIRFSRELKEEIAGDAWTALVLQDVGRTWPGPPRSCYVHVEDEDRPRTMTISLDVDYGEKIIRIGLVRPCLIL